MIYLLRRGCGQDWSPLPVSVQAAALLLLLLRRGSISSVAAAAAPSQQQQLLFRSSSLLAAAAAPSPQQQLLRSSSMQQQVTTMVPMIMSPPHFATFFLKVKVVQHWPYGYPFLIGIPLFVGNPSYVIIRTLGHLISLFKLQQSLLMICFRFFLCAVGRLLFGI